MTVEAEDGGRLFVSGKAAPGATVRLYLNESFIAPGGAGGDGRVSFAIARGVQPGDYRVRIDDVDPVSGPVKSRAEVAFNVSPAADRCRRRRPSPQLPAGQAPTSPQSAGPAPARPSAAAPQQAAAAALAAARARCPRPVLLRLESTVGGAAAGRQVRSPSSRREARAADRHGRHPRRQHGDRLAGRQPLADQPADLRQGRPLHGHLQRESAQIRNPHLIYPGQVFVAARRETMQAQRANRDARDLAAPSADG